MSRFLERMDFVERIRKERSSLLERCRAIGCFGPRASSEIIYGEMVERTELALIHAD